MTTKYKKKVFLLMLAEECNRCKDMIQFIEDIVNHKCEDLKKSERDIISFAYNKSISSRRKALKKINALEKKEKKKKNSTCLLYIKEYKKKIEDELTELCQGILKTIDEKLFKLAVESEAQVFFLKMKGDYNKYIAEYAEGDLKKKVSDDALKSYESASIIAKDLPALNPIVLGLAFNFSVFYYDIINDPKKAIEIAKTAMDEADKELYYINEDSEKHKESVSLFYQLKENIDIWVKKEEGNQ